MVNVKYSARILADSDFVKWLIKEDKSQFFHLTHIKASSLDSKKEHNVMIEEDIKEILDMSQIKETTLRGAFKGKNTSIISNLLKINIDKRVVLAIVLATMRPFKTYIFTTKANEEAYKNSSHYKNVRSISVKCEEDALEIINSFWKEFKKKRDST